eukprot:scaffold6296_cov124-Isochrysis_galbana.AAC.5
MSQRPCTASAPSTNRSIPATPPPSTPCPTLPQSVRCTPSLRVASTTTMLLHCAATSRASSGDSPNPMRIDFARSTTALRCRCRRSSMRSSASTCLTQLSQVSARDAIVLLLLGASAAEAFRSTFVLAGSSAPLAAAAALRPPA